MSGRSCILLGCGSVKTIEESSIGVMLSAAVLSRSAFQNWLWGGVCGETRRERSVSVALFSCCLVSQCLTILSVWPSVWGRGVSVVSGWCLGLSEVSCVLSGGDRIKTARARSV